MTKRQPSMLQLLVTQDGFWGEAEEVLNLPSSSEKELVAKHQALLEICNLMRMANEIDQQDDTECPFKCWREIKPRFEVLVAALIQIDSSMTTLNRR